MKFSPPEFDMPQKEELVFRVRLSAHMSIIYLMLCLIAYAGYALTSQGDHLIFFVLSNMFLVAWIIFFVLFLYLFLVFAVSKIFVSTHRIYGRFLLKRAPADIMLSSVIFVRAHYYLQRLPACGGVVTLYLKNKKKRRLHCVLAPMATAEALNRLIKKRPDDFTSGR